MYSRNLLEFLGSVVIARACVVLRCFPGAKSSDNSLLSTGCSLVGTGRKGGSGTLGSFWQDLAGQTLLRLLFGTSSWAVVLSSTQVSSTRNRISRCSAADLLLTSLTTAMLRQRRKALGRRSLLLMLVWRLSSPNFSSRLKLVNVAPLGLQTFPARVHG